MNIRNERSADVTAIKELTKAAFKDAPHSDHVEHLIVEALRSSGKLSISLVAEIDGMIVGHVAVSPVSISDGTDGWYGLGPISVVPRCQRKGIGSQLMKSALDKLKELEALGCVLLGDPNYYSRFGFKADMDLIFPGVPPEYFQALAFGASMPKGEVTYHESFYGLG